MDPRSQPSRVCSDWTPSPLPKTPTLTVLFGHPKQSADVIDMAAWRAEHGK
jgi:hypothetical protein